MSDANGQPPASKISVEGRMVVPEQARTVQDDAAFVGPEVCASLTTEERMTGFRETNTGATASFTKGQSVMSMICHAIAGSGNVPHC